MLAMVEAVCFPFFVVLSVPLFQFLKEGEPVDVCLKSLKAKPFVDNLAKPTCQQMLSPLQKQWKAKPFVHLREKNAGKTVRSCAKKLRRSLSWISWDASP